MKYFKNDIKEELGILLNKKIIKFKDEINTVSTKILESEELLNQLKHIKNLLFDEYNMYSIYNSKLGMEKALRINFNDEYRDEQELTDKVVYPEIRDNHRMVEKLEKSIDDDKLKLKILNSSLNQTINDLKNLHDIPKETTYKINENIKEEAAKKLKIEREEEEKRLKIKRENEEKDLTEKIDNLQYDIENNYKIINELSTGNIIIEKSNSYIYKILIILVVITIIIIILGYVYNNMIFISLIPIVGSFIYAFYKLYANNSNININTKIYNKKVIENKNNQRMLDFYINTKNYKFNNSLLNTKVIAVDLPPSL